MSETNGAVTKAPARRTASATAGRAALAQNEGRLRKEAVALLASDIVRRQQFAKRAGLQYGTKRDVYATAGYVAVGTETYDHYRALYDRNEIARRIVSLPVAATWKTPPEIKEDGEADTTFSKEFTKLAKRLKLWQMFSRADKLSRIGEYAVVLIGVKGTDQDLASEMPKLKGPQDVAFLSTFSQKNAAVSEWETDTGNPRFGLPKVYQIEVSSGTKGFPARQLPVHASRILHVAEDLLEDEVHGQPALQAVLNRIFDLDKITASTGEAYWQVATRILMGEVDADSEITDADLTLLGEKMEEVVHDLRRQMLLQGGKMSWLTTTTPNPGESFDMYASLIAAGCGIPKRILFGSERGELASTQDDASFQAQINSRQEQHAEPQILRAFIDLLVEKGGLPKPKSEEKGYDVIWAPGHEQTDEEKADLNNKIATTAKQLTAIGGDPLVLVLIDDEGALTLKSSEQIEEDMAAAAEEEAQAQAAELDAQIAAGLVVPPVVPGQPGQPAPPVPAAKPAAPAAP